jgi:hypothetical protein
MPFMALTSRSWKGRDFTVIALEGLTRDYIRELTNFHFPEWINTESAAYAYVNYAGMRMRFSEELIEAMIRIRTGDAALIADILSLS